MATKGEPRPLPLWMDYGRPFPADPLASPLGELVGWWLEVKSGL